MTHLPWPTHRSAAATLALSLLVGFAGCTDDPASTDENSMMEPADNNPNRDPGPTVPPPENSQLRHVDDGTCSPETTLCTDDTIYSSARKLRVQLVDANGAPVVNSDISFEITESDAEGTQLTSARASTDAEGIAEVDLKTGASSGTARVTASTSDPDVNIVEFLIDVRSKSAADLEVNFLEVGDTDLKKVDVFLFDSNTSCDAFLNNPPTAQNTRSGMADPTGTPAHGRLQRGQQRHQLHHRRARLRSHQQRRRGLDWLRPRRRRPRDHERDGRHRDRAAAQAHPLHGRRIQRRPLL